jgi:hypothetical protein
LFVSNLQTSLFFLYAHQWAMVLCASYMPEVLDHSWLFSEHYFEKYPIHELIFERTVASVDLIVF